MQNKNDKSIKMEDARKNLKQSLVTTLFSLKQASIFIISTILLVSLISTLVPESFYLAIFKGNFFIDPVIGAIIGSISIGMPLISYILGGEFLQSGISIIAVTAFIVACPCALTVLLGTRLENTTNPSKAKVRIAATIIRVI